MQKMILYVRNMTCVNCERKIETELKHVRGILEVKANYKTNQCHITYDDTLIKAGQILRRLEDIDYPSSLTPPKQNLVSKAEWNDISKAVFLLVAIYFILKGLGITDLFYQFPQAKENMDYGMLFIIGIFTSFHCMAMCGGLHLSQALKKVDTNAAKAKSVEVLSNSVWKNEKMAPFLYNAGRLVSYSLLGAVIGGIGSVFHISLKMNGIIEIIAGIFMMCMGLNLLNIFPILHVLAIRFPQRLTKKMTGVHSFQNPLVVGLFNGFMPCGPLQAMQLYALSTGSPIKGAISMFLFCLGTMPAMLGLGIVSSWLSRKFQHKIAYMGAILVIVLGFGMFKSGFVLAQVKTNTNVATIQSTETNQTQLNQNQDNTNITIDNQSNAKEETTTSDQTTKEETATNNQTTNDQTAGKQEESSTSEQPKNEQMVESTFDSYSYKPIKVKVNVPVVWTIHVKKGFLSGCNYRMILPEYNVQKELKEGDNVIKFTPTATGDFPYSCWMGMVRSTITVTN